MSTTSTQEYLIIAGTTKAATTSLFMYLSEHPEVCGSSLKETRFFIDADYPVHPLGAHCDQGLEGYNEFFLQARPGQRLRVEATPDYLYSSGTPERLATALPLAKVVVVLREPIARLVSWYHYASQRSFLPKSMSFEEYAELQLSGEEAILQFEKMPLERDETIPLRYFLSALGHGRYSDYLQEFSDHLKADRLLVLFYEDILSDAESCMKAICNFADIDPVFYSDFNPQRYNKSVAVKSHAIHKLYELVRTGVRKRTHNLPIHKVLRALKKKFDPLYDRLNTSSIVKGEMSPDLRARLETYYQEDRQRVETLVGRPVPW